MPTYLYRCDVCNMEEEAQVAVEHRDDLRLHSCGCPMKRTYTPQPIIMKPTGKGMAADALNSKAALPDRWYKNKYENLAAQGLGSRKRTQW